MINQDELDGWFLSSCREKKKEEFWSENSMEKDHEGDPWWEDNIKTYLL